MLEELKQFFWARCRFYAKTIRLSFIFSVVAGTLIAFSAYSPREAIIFWSGWMFGSILFATEGYWRPYMDRFFREVKQLIME